MFDVAVQWEGKGLPDKRAVEKQIAGAIYAAGVTSMLYNDGKPLVTVIIKDDGQYRVCDLDSQNADLLMEQLGKLPDLSVKKIRL